MELKNEQVTLLDHYLKVLRGVGPWFLRGKLIRNELGECPICAIARHKTNKRFGNGDWAFAASKIGLRQDQAIPLIFAADGTHAGLLIATHIRHRLLNELGITQTGEG